MEADPLAGGAYTFLTFWLLYFLLLYFFFIYFWPLYFSKELCEQVRTAVAFLSSHFLTFFFFFLYFFAFELVEVPGAGRQPIAQSPIRA